MHRFRLHQQSDASSHSSDSTVLSACRTAGISDKTSHGWRKRYGGMGRAKLSEFKALEKEKHRLKRLWESLNWIS